MHNPSHPGAIVKSSIEALDLSVTKAAEILGVSRQALSTLINERSSLSPEMAIRLEKAFGSTVETWFRMQNNFDIWQAKQHADEIHVERYEGAWF
jgi:antitoxin HigA-1